MPSFTTAVRATAAGARDYPVRFAAIRYTIYTVLVGILLQCLLWLSGHERFAELFQESALIEWLQFLLAGGISGSFLLAAMRCPSFRASLRVLAAVSGIAVMRELDATLEGLIPVLGWKLPAGVCLATAAMLVLRGGEAFWRQIVAWLRTPAFGLLWCGFILVVLFAQIIGQAEVWEAIMADAYERQFKRALEETTETFGYVILLIGTIEAVLYLPVATRTDTGEG